MITVFNSLVQYLYTILTTIVNFTIPSGNDDVAITVRSIAIFLLLTRVAWAILKMFLSKDHMENSANGKD